MNLQHLLLAAGVWVVASVPAALIIARVIRARDEHEAPQQLAEDTNAHDEGRHLRLITCGV